VTYSQPDKTPEAIWYYISNERLAGEVMCRYKNLRNFYETLGLDIYFVYALCVANGSLANLPSDLSMDQALSTKLPGLNVQSVVNCEQPYLGSLTTKQVIELYGEQKYIIGVVPGTFELAQRLHLIGTESVLLNIALHKNKAKFLFQLLALNFDSCKIKILYLW